MDDYFGPGTEEDVGPIDEQTFCLGGHPQCADCSKTAPYTVAHPPEPQFNVDNSFVVCEPGSSCQDGYVWWQEFEEEGSDWEECNPSVPGCYDQIGVDVDSGRTQEYYFWCNGR